MDQKTEYLDRWVSEKIDTLGLGCAMSVVFIHSFIGVTFQDRAVSQLTQFIQEFISHGMARIAVPYFFVVSGYFLFRDFRVDLDWYWNKLKSKLRTLIVPYVIWSLLGLIFAVFVSNLPSATAQDFNWGSFTWWIKVFGLIEKPLFLGQLWYVHMLMEWIVLAPIVGIMITRCGYWMPFVCFAVMLIPTLSNPWVNALMYISFGGCIAIRPLRDTSRIYVLIKEHASILLIAWLLFLLFRAWLVGVQGIALADEFVFLSIPVGLGAVWMKYDAIGWLGKMKIRWAGGGILLIRST